MFNFDILKMLDTGYFKGTGTIIKRNGNKNIITDKIKLDTDTNTTQVIESL